MSRLNRGVGRRSAVADPPDARDGGVASDVSRFRMPASCSCRGCARVLRPRSTSPIRSARTCAARSISRRRSRSTACRAIRSRCGCAVRRTSSASIRTRSCASTRSRARPTSSRTTSRASSSTGRISRGCSRRRRRARTRSCGRGCAWSSCAQQDGVLLSSSADAPLPILNIDGAREAGRRAAGSGRLVGVGARAGRGFEPCRDRSERAEERHADAAGALALAPAVPAHSAAEHRLRRLRRADVRAGPQGRAGRGDQRHRADGRECARSPRGRSRRRRRRACVCRSTTTGGSGRARAATSNRSFACCAPCRRRTGSASGRWTSASRASSCRRRSRTTRSFRSKARCGALENREFEPWPDDAQEPFQTELAKIINAPGEALIIDPDSDPLLAPPLYGQWHAARSTVTRAARAVVR